MAKREQIAQFELTSADTHNEKDSKGNNVTVYSREIQINGQEYNFNYQHINITKYSQDGSEYTIIGECNNSMEGTLVKIYKNTYEGQGKWGTKQNNVSWGGSFCKQNGKTVQSINVQQIPSLDEVPSFKFTISQNPEYAEAVVKNSTDNDMNFGETNEEYKARIAAKSEAVVKEVVAEVGAAGAETAKAGDLPF